MDHHTQKNIDRFNSHRAIKRNLTIICYILIFAGITNYIIHAASKSKTITIVNQFKDKKKQLSSDKEMTNPETRIRYNDADIYHIKAKRASHKDNGKINLIDVTANSDLGNIKAGNLAISADGEVLTFTEKPVLILNETK